MHVSGNTQWQRIRIPGGFGQSFFVKKDQLIGIIDVDGGQCADFWAIDKCDFNHYLSPPHSIVHINSLQPKIGDCLLTNRRHPILKIVADDVGEHDMLFPACDKQRYSIYFGVTGHRNCHDNFLEAMKPHDWGSRQVPCPPLNVFMNTSVKHDGGLITREPLSKAGDRFIVRAEMDVVCVVSSCPIDLTPTGSTGITDIDVLISDNLDNF
jgi:uncharacterized protein YcgI (DUF1989 family)